MRHTILALLLMIAVGVFASAHGRDTQRPNVLVFDSLESRQPYVVLAKNGTGQQKEASKECLVLPNRDLKQPETNERESSLMKGLVF